MRHRKKTRKEITKKIVHSQRPRTSRRSVIAYNIPDMPLLWSIFGLVLFGLFMIASAGVIYGEFRFNDAYHFFKQQFVGVILGTGALLFFMSTDYHRLRYWSPLFFGIAIMLLVAVHIPGLGVEAYGARRWIALGSISFQPAEAVKLGMIIFVAAWCASKGVRRIQDFSEGALPFVMIVSIVSFLMLKQPDVGTMGVIVMALGSIFFVAGARIMHILALGTSALVSLAVLIVSSDYRRERFLTFLDPNSDPLGSSYQITQALIAIGSGGVFGVGPGYSRQKGLYLPEPVGDSIFAIIAEELGFVGGVLLLAAFGFLAFRLYKIACAAPDVFGRLIVVGIGTWIVGQAIINIAAISGIMPLTGIPLSFISYGGTSILVMLAAMGIVLNISRQADTS